MNHPRKCATLISLAAVLWAAGCQLRPHETTSDKGAGVLAMQPSWTLTLDEQVAASPVLSGDRLYVRTERTLVAADLHTGMSLWTASSPSPEIPSWPALVAGDSILVDEYGSRMAAFNLQSGELKWRTELISIDRLYSPPIQGMAVVGNLLAVARSNWALTTYSIEDGHVVWEWPISHRDSLSLAADEKDFFLVAGSDLSAYDASNGSIVWTQTLDALLGPMAFAEDTIYVSDERQPGLWAINAADGRVRWHRALTQLRPYDVQCVNTDGNTVVVAATSAAALSAEGGALLWTSDDLGLLECPLWIGHSILIRNTESMLFALDGTTGGVVGSMEVPYNTSMQNEPDRGPAALGDLLVIPTSNHTLAAYSLAP